MIKRKSNLALSNKITSNIWSRGEKESSAKIGNEFFAIFSFFNAAIDGYPHYLINYNLYTHSTAIRT